MSEGTKIEWCDASWSPWIGCTKVSPGCAHCYAEMSTPTRVARSKGTELWGNGKARQRTSAATWRNPVKWNYGPRIFPSLCDWLDEEVPVEWLADFLKLIHDTPNLDWLLLTKRPENFFPRLKAVLKLWSNNGAPDEEDAVWNSLVRWLEDGSPPANVWIGTSVEDQKRAEERIPELLKIPAAVRFLSVEPLLGPVDLRRHTSGHEEAGTPFSGARTVGGCVAWTPPVDWVIVGGESGPGTRACNVEWIRGIVRQCRAAGVPCFVKQLGAISKGGTPTVAWEWNHPKGGDPAEWPEDLRVREFPNRAEARA